MSPIPHAAVERQRAHGRSQRQLILDYIAAYQAEHGWAPTVREITTELGLASPSTAHDHLRQLRDAGKLVLGGGPRMIRLTNGHIDLRPGVQERAQWGD